MNNKGCLNRLFYNAELFLRVLTRIKDRIFEILERFLNSFSSPTYAYYKLFAQRLYQFLNQVPLTGSKSDFFKTNFSIVTNGRIKRGTSIIENGTALSSL